ncbi:concanavalin A-like lectin/glucanase domain-containing protein [Roridomyces roridus]|uniref:Endo-1,4-beta-xylanase n=1 Tax=Roridomyces roridus TaxID=1738132 RepID=A0AAD7BIW3_9AGAR|nr:concanavalin A-like lectin/glucanase domain-containing protein [Roridomyces roridus]
MIALPLLFALLARFTFTAAVPANESGLIFGYFFAFSADDGDAATFTNEDDGEYAIQWGENSGHFIGGAGWTPGSPQSISYSTFSPVGNSWFSIYGWTTDPLVEYRILEENFGGVDPTVGLTSKGSLTSDGSVYDIYEAQIVDGVSPVGTSNFTQYWSIRQSPVNAGIPTVTTQNHFTAWAAAGMPLGTFGYQIVATEQVGGASTATNAGSLSVLVRTRPAGFCAIEYAQCGGEGFTGPNCCVSNTTCVQNNQFFSQCLAD